MLAFPGPSPLVPAPVLLRARIVLPLAQAPIEDGAVLVSGGRILEVGRWQHLHGLTGQRSVDLGEVILLPGLINAHCHLDYTGMAGQISAPKSFSDWIKALLALKAHWVYSDYAASWLLGAKMLLDHGVTTVADIEAVPEMLPEVRLATRLRVCSLIEMTGVRSRRHPDEILQDAIDRIDSLPGGGNWAGLSPHAPYSTTPELLRLSGGAARQRGWRVATHVSESAEEFEMFNAARGPMFEWLKPQRDMSDCGRGSPVDSLEQAGLLADNLLAIHVNYLAPGDAGLLARRGSTVVHCPRSHAYFQHQSFPFDTLRGAGVNVCVGTDSLVSSHESPGEKLELSLLTELRLLQRAQPTLAPEVLLRMVTVQAAKALGLPQELGQLSAGAWADLIVIPGCPSPENAYEVVIAHNRPVGGVMIGGEWVIAPL